MKRQRKGNKRKMKKKIDIHKRSSKESDRKTTYNEMKLSNLLKKGYEKGRERKRKREREREKRAEKKMKYSQTNKGKTEDRIKKKWKKNEGRQKKIQQNTK